METGGQQNPHLVSVAHKLTVITIAVAHQLFLDAAHNAGGTVAVGIGHRVRQNVDRGKIGIAGRGGAKDVLTFCLLYTSRCV